jgi:hypothetical protein
MGSDDRLCAADNLLLMAAVWQLRDHRVRVTGGGVAGFGATVCCVCVCVCGAAVVCRVLGAGAVVVGVCVEV